MQTLGLRTLKFLIISTICNDCSLKTTYYILMTAALLAAIWNRKSLPKRVGIFIPLLMAGIGVQFIHELWPLWLGNRYTKFHLYQFVALPLLMFYLIHTIRSRRWRAYFKIGIPLFYILVFIIFQVLPQSWESYYFPDQQLLGLAVVVGTFVIFYEIYQNETIVTLRHSPDFWLGVANLIYYSGFSITLGTYWYINEVVGDKIIAEGVLMINRFLNLFLYFFYIIAFLCPRRAKKSSSLSS